MRGKIMELIGYRGLGLCIGVLFYWRGFERTAVAASLAAPAPRRQENENILLS